MCLDSLAFACTSNPNPNPNPNPNQVCLDSLAFACTYGKKNCLTDEMYRGELSMGKVPPPPTNWYTLLTLFSVAYLA